MAQFGWRVIIADESHTLRTSNRAPDARHTEAVASAVKRATRAIFLSGTPSLSRPFDLFRQVGSPDLHYREVVALALKRATRAIFLSGTSSL